MASMLDRRDWMCNVDAEVGGGCSRSSSSSSSFAAEDFPLLLVLMLEVMTDPTSADRRRSIGTSS